MAIYKAEFLDLSHARVPTPEFEARATCPVCTGTRWRVEGLWPIPLDQLAEDEEPPQWPVIIVAVCAACDHQLLKSLA